MIFSVEGDVPTALTSLGYLLGAVTRDAEMPLYVCRIFRFELIKICVPTDCLFKIMNSGFPAITRQLTRAQPESAGYHVSRISRISR